MRGACGRPLGLLALDGVGSGLGRKRGCDWVGAEGDSPGGGEGLEEALELGVSLESCQLIGGCKRELLELASSKGCLQLCWVHSWQEACLRKTNHLIWLTLIYLRIW